MEATQEGRHHTTNTTKCVSVASKAGSWRAPRALEVGSGEGKRGGGRFGSSQGVEAAPVGMGRAGGRGDRVRRREHPAAAGIEGRVSRRGAGRVEGGGSHRTGEEA
nr:unnamed protein product [Digitaria exilis]